MIDIIGGGIGGLTTAIALEQKKIPYRVFEQAPAFQPLGAGIILANNAMQVYQHLGLKATLEQCGNHISTVALTRPNLTPVSTMDLTYFEHRYGVKNTAIHRGTLQQILFDHIPSASLYLNHKLLSIDKEDNAFILRFNNQASKKSHQLLGADGIHSKVRNTFLPGGKIRETDQICWRGVTSFDLPKKYKHTLYEAWGKGNRFGFVQIAEGKVYWYALLSTQKKEPVPLTKELPSHFKDYHSIVSELIAATAIETIHTASITDLYPIKKWYDHHIGLLGDAAHATTPNMGQGACQAIEDAYVLANCLEKYDFNKALKTYQRKRLTKAHNVVNTSWKIGQMAHWSNPISIQLRNLLLSTTPKWVSQKQSTRLFQLSSP